MPAGLPARALSPDTLRLTDSYSLTSPFSNCLHSNNRRVSLNSGEGNGNPIQYPRLRNPKGQRSQAGYLRATTETHHVCVCVCVCSQLCPTLWDPMDCSPPGYSARGIFQVRILEWFAISYSRRSSQQRDQTHISCVSCIGKEGSLPLEPLGKTKYIYYIIYIIYIYINTHTHTHTHTYIIPIV